MTKVTRRTVPAAISAAVLLAALLPWHVAAATPTLALSLAVAPNPVSYLAPIRIVGGLKPISGTPTNFSVHMEPSPGPFAGGDCPDPNCSIDTYPTWTFDSLTKPTTVSFDTSAKPGQTIRFYLDGGNAGCDATCPAQIVIKPAAVSSRVDLDSAGQVVTGATLHVIVSASSNAPLVEGDLHVDLPAGVDAPTNLPANALYSGPPFHYVYYATTADPTALYEFDVLVNATSGSTLTFGSTFFPSDGTSTGTSSVTSFKVGTDTTKPVATAPTRSLGGGRTLVSSRIPVLLRWAGSDAGSGVERFVLAQQVDGAPWTTVATGIRGSSAVRYLSGGHTYRFRVRAEDRAGNLGSWATGAPFRLAKVSEGSSAVRYSGTWTSVTSTAYLGDKARAASATGARATYTFTGSAVGWVAMRGPTRGRASIYVNGELAATVDLFAPSVQAPYLAWSRAWSTSATRTIAIRVAGTAGRARVEVDGFVTAR